MAIKGPVDDYSPWYKDKPDCTVATLETKYGKVEIKHNEGDMTINNLIELVIKPMLIASTYPEALVEEVLGNG